MVPSREMAKVNKNDWDEKSLALLAQHLSESIFTSNGLFKALQDELLVGTRTRVEVQKDLQQLKENVDQVVTLLMKGGKDSLVAQVSVLQAEIANLEKKLMEHRAVNDRATQDIVAAESKCQKAFESLKQSILDGKEELRDVIDKRVRELREEFSDQLEKQEDDQKGSRERRKDRKWNFFSQVFPTILGWIVAGLIALFAYWAKKP